MTPQPSGEYPVQVSVEYPDKQSRLLALFSIPFFLLRAILLIPQIIVLYFIEVAAFVVAWINFFAVLFTGHSSESMHTFVVGWLRWSTRVDAYMYGLTDKYPPFRFKP